MDVVEDYRIPMWGCSLLNALLFMCFTRAVRWRTSGEPCGT